jgi:hypothetical protein
MSEGFPLTKDAPHQEPLKGEMLPASLYTPLYFHTMLLAVFGCALLYWAEQGRFKNLNQFNQVAMIVMGVGLVLFMGFRPVSGVFIDMPNYAKAYERVRSGGDGNFPDRLFNGVMQLCAPILPTGGFFFVCALIYIAPLAVAFRRVHLAWAFPVFLSCLTAFSFWGYGVNGIRNGMATSVLILAFAFHDKPVVMFPLMAAAWGLHGTSLLPASAFLIVRYVRRTELWLAFWIVCVTVSLLAGNIGELLLSHYNPFAWDNRVETYVLGSEGSSFRADFLAYSIIPILVTLLLAAPARTRLRQAVARTKNRPSLHRMRYRSALNAKRMGMKRLACMQATIGQVDVVPASFPRAGNDRTNSAGGAWKASRNVGGSGTHREAKQNGWNTLRWVRLLQSDPFYARLVNTYLLANAIWVLLINANFSNRFAYLSWFMMPWILLYPFVPSKNTHHPRTDLIAGALCAQYLFTYIMGIVVYPMRGLN